MKRYRLTRSVLYLIFLGAAVYFVLPQLTTIETASQTLSNLNRYWLAVAVMAQILSYLASGYLVTSVVRLSGDVVSPIRGVLITLAANTIGTLGGGFLTTATASYRWIRGRASAGTAALSGWLPPIINNCALVVLSNWGLLVLLLKHDLRGAVLATLIVMQAIMATVLIGIGWSLSHQQQITQRVEKLWDKWKHLKRGDAGSAKVRSITESLFASINLLSSGNWSKPALWSALNVGFDSATLFFLFAAVRHPIGVSALLAGYAIPQLVGKILFIPGGVGAVEASMVALYASLGVRNEIGVIVVLAYRVISFWAPTLLGLIVAPYLEHASRNSRAA